ncbi:site-specific DNA-methyltransferase [Microbacterium sp. HA-8]|uniref:DNA-methyltransferase n=1 Tax=Microbacterium sp. HA-8 TaxID=3234200 RepID=UPI0038F702F7
MTATTRVLHADALTALADLPDNSVDSIVTDPPYGLADLNPALIADVMTRWLSGERDAAPSGKGFMGKSWDSFVPPPAIWDEALRVLKPGGHLLAFAGSRTVDLMGLSIRLAGFEIRDQIQWIYGTGFPKSLDVSKAIDKQAGAAREVIGSKVGLPGYSTASGGESEWGGLRGNPCKEAEVTAPATPEATTWQGWGTALKPAHEPIVVARKPLIGTVAANVLAHGTGALNIDASRIGTAGGAGRYVSGSEGTETVTAYGDGLNGGKLRDDTMQGRWPANVVLDEAAAAVLGEQSADVSRFFYVAKAPKSERPIVNGAAHPTVKPLTLMRYLVKMVTPPGGTVLDPFAGSGTTLEAAAAEGFSSIGIEMDAGYIDLITHRLARAGITARIDPVSIAA